MEPNEIIEQAKAVIKDEAYGILSIEEQIDESFVEAVQLIRSCHGHILVTGSGTSSSVARRMAHLLSCCGVPALFIDAGDSQHGLSGAITESDILIAFSKGGGTAEVVFLGKVAKDKGANLISICENPQSELGHISDVVLKIVAPQNVDPYGMIATGSSLINSVVGDAIAIVLLKLNDYSVEDFGKTHPGGAVGRKINELQNEKKGN